ncbi:MAG TPA: diguanylate cyclase [Methylomirabilota bacterium]|nr:diguanylate cyclase [Methylomirabilota bacterium]
MAILESTDFRRRSGLLILVFGASLALVAATAFALVTVVSDGLTRAAIDSSVRSDRSLVQGFVASNLYAADLKVSGVDPTRVSAIELQIAAFIRRSSVAGQSPGIVHVKIWLPDGTVLYSERGDLRGVKLGLDDEIADAIGGNAVASTIEEADSGEAATSNLPPGTEVLEEYIPIELGGSIPAVFEIYREATPIVAAVDQTRMNVLTVTAVAAAILGILLFLIFRTAQARLTRQTRQLFEASRRDALTGLLNHGSAVAELATLLEATRESGAAVGVALVDIDGFRLLNETYGHAAGDGALVSIARALRTELSVASTIGRFGPDEFIVVAPPSCVGDLEPAIDRLRTRIEQLSLQFGASERLPVSVSCGICYFPTNGTAATNLLAVATGALSEAKAGGGRGVRVAQLDSDDLAIAQRSSFDVLTGLVEAVDTKDRYTKQHSEDVARYAVFLADQLGLGPEERQSIELAGLLHDVGKIGVPGTILRKPGPLTGDEYDAIKQHPALGDAIVRDLPNVEAVKAGVRHHHERWDGTGYIDGLAGEDIPLIARIVSVADAFSAMTTTRPYRKALTVAEALHRLREASGTQLDPRLVTAFVDAIEADTPGLPADLRTGVMGLSRGRVA